VTAPALTPIREHRRPRCLNPRCGRVLSKDEGIPTATGRSPVCDDCLVRVRPMWMRGGGR
jgi:hypothetical protein